MLGVYRAAGFSAELLGAAAKNYCASGFLNGEDENWKQRAIDDELDIEDPAKVSVWASKQYWVRMEGLPSPCA